MLTKSNNSKYQALSDYQWYELNKDTTPIIMLIYEHNKVTTLIIYEHNLGQTLYTLSIHITRILPPLSMNITRARHYPHYL